MSHDEFGFAAGESGLCTGGSASKRAESFDKPEKVSATVAIRFTISEIHATVNNVKIATKARFLDRGTLDTGHPGVQAIVRKELELGIGT